MYTASGLRGGGGGARLFCPIRTATTAVPAHARPLSLGKTVISQQKCDEISLGFAQTTALLNSQPHSMPFALWSRPRNHLACPLSSLQDLLLSVTFARTEEAVLSPIGGSSDPGAPTVSACLCTVSSSVVTLDECSFASCEVHVSSRLEKCYSVFCRVVGVCLLSKHSWFLWLLSSNTRPIALGVLSSFYDFCKLPGGPL